MVSSEQGVVVLGPGEGAVRSPVAKRDKSYGSLWPREHGAWGMLALPFLSGAVLGGSWHWALPFAALAAVSAFLAREPVVVLFRQRYVWTAIHPESRQAGRILWLLGAVLTASALVLRDVVALTWLISLGGVLVAVTTCYVWASLHNRQRSVLLQVVGAAGLTLTAVIGYLPSSGGPDRTLVLLYGAHLIYSVGSILVVRARLETRLSPDRPFSASRMWQLAVLWQIVPAAALILLAFAEESLLLFPVAAAALVHVFDLCRLRTPRELARTLRSVGFRALGLSIVFTCLVVFALW